MRDDLQIGDRFVWAGGRRSDVVYIEIFIPQEAPTHVVTRHEWGGDRPIFDTKSIEDFEEMVRDGELVKKENANEHEQ
jgi:hypothetical protein